MLSPGKEGQRRSWTIWAAYSDKHSPKLIILLTVRDGVTQSLVCFQFPVRHQIDSSQHFSQNNNDNNKKIQPNA